MRKYVTMLNDEIPLLEMNFPIDYREEIVSKIFNCIRKNESFSFIGMEDNAKVNTLRFVTFRKEVQKRYLGKDFDRYLYVLIDLNELMDINITCLYHLIALSLIETLKASKFKFDYLNNLFIDHPTLLLKSLKEDLNLVIKKTKKEIVFIFNEFDLVNKYMNSDLILRNLVALRNIARFKISYVFIGLKPFLVKSQLNQKIIWCPPLTGKDVIGTIERNAARYGIEITKSQKKIIIDMTGGHSGTIKFIIQELSKNNVNDYDRILKNIDKQSDVCFQQERLLKTLNEIEKIKLKNKEKDELLMNLGFQVEDEGQIKIFSKLLEKYLNSDSCQIKPFCYDLENEEIYYRGKAVSRILSNKEMRLLKLLVNNEGKIIKRDEIINKVWNENETPSDWSLDKMVSRLRKKLDDEKQVNIRTIKGMGIYLNNFA